MSFLYMMLVLQSGPADAALERYARFAATHPIVSVHFRAKVVNQPDATGNMLLERERRVLFNAKWGGGDYTLSVSELGIREVERTDQRYDEFPYPGKILLQESKLTNAGTVYPGVFSMMDLRRIAPPGNRFEHKGTRSIEGRSGDVVAVKYSSPMGGSGSIEATIASDGQLLQYHEVLKNPMGGMRDVEWHFNRYTFPKRLTSQNFYLAIPDGFTPRSVPNIGWAIQPEESLPDITLRRASGADASLRGATGGKTTLFVLLGPDCPQSAGLATHFPELGGLAQIVPVSISPQAQQAHRWGENTLYDPTGRVLDRLQLMGTPMCYLVGADGKVRKVWLGYDEEDPKRLLRELTEALKEPAKP